MQFWALKLTVHIFRINLGIHHFALYGLYLRRGSVHWIWCLWISIWYVQSKKRSDLTLNLWLNKLINSVEHTSLKIRIAMALPSFRELYIISTPAKMGTNLWRGLSLKFTFKTGYTQHTTWNVFNDWMSNNVKALTASMWKMGG